MIGSRLKQLREDADMTQNDLGQELSLSRDTISRYERNVIFPPDEVKILICRLFGVSMDYLFGLSDEEGYTKQAESRLDRLVKGEFAEEPVEITDSPGFVDRQEGTEGGLYVNEEGQKYDSVSPVPEGGIDQPGAACNHQAGSVCSNPEKGVRSKGVHPPTDYESLPDRKLSEMTFGQLVRELEPYIVNWVTRTLNMVDTEEQEH